MSVPKLRFKADDGSEFPEWNNYRAEDLFENIVDKNHPDEEVLTIIQGIGTVPRKDAGRNIQYDHEYLANYKYVQKNDFIIHLRSFEGGLEIANSNGIVSPAYIILRSKDKVAPHFYNEYFHTNEFINHNLAKAVEGIRDGRQISYDAFRRLPLPRCSFQEQHKIADFFSTLDQIINKTQAEVDAWEKQKQGMMHKLFSQEIRFKADDGSEYPEWEEMPLGKIATFFSGGTPSVGHEEYYNGNIYFIRSGEIHSDVTELHISQDGLNSSSAQMVNKGDLLYALYGATSGDVAISKIEGAINQAILCIRTREDYDRKFLSYILEFNKKNILEKYLQGGQGNLSAQIVKSLKFSFPVLDEQQEIADCLSAFDEVIDKTKQELEAYKQLKKGLMQQMFI